MIIIHKPKTVHSEALLITGRHENIHDLFLSVLLKYSDLSSDGIRRGLRNGTYILIIDGYGDFVDTEYLERSQAFISHYLRENLEATLV